MYKYTGFIIYKMSNIRRILITGSPGSGKTTIIKGLKKKGYKVFDEFSRSLIKVMKIAVMKIYF